MPRKQNPLDFEAALADLEQIVNQLEKGDLSLEESLRAYERGVNLGRTCQQALDAAEQRIQILTQQDADATPQPFEPIEPIEPGSGDDDDDDA